jgi:lipopolysaccharide biosynthesis regulator YciM
MIGAPDLEMDYPIATDGEISVINLESSRLQAWSKFWQAPLRPGIAEYIVEQEHLTAQFLGDLDALARLDTLVNHLNRVDAESSRTSLINAQVASAAHRFADARTFLARVATDDELSALAGRLLLSIDQACGTGLEVVLESRRRMAAESGRLEDLVPLGALHADLREFDEADRIYQQAMNGYQDVSPFALAWVCFQLGVLWGELASDSQTKRAAIWYRKAIEYVPAYVKARVHLAEIYLDEGRAQDAKSLLVPALSSGDPEVNWRLGDTLIAMGRTDEGKEHLETARNGFEALLQQHLLAFADHGAEFYSGSGNNPDRAFELASLNLANRSTLRAFEQTYEAALAACRIESASNILNNARERWGASSAFQLSPLAAQQ